MQNEKLQINLTEGIPKAEVILREVHEVNELPVKKPVVIELAGTIGSPFEFLSKRYDQPNQINQKRCHVIVNRSDISINLIINENDAYNRGTVSGKLEFNPKFIEFGINTGKEWTPTQLGLFFKMNRAFFTSKDENMKLVTELLNFTATVNNTMQQSANERGDRTDQFSQVVNSNLPKSFNLVIPVFKGSKPETIEVETFAQVDGRDVSFMLISPGAQAVMEELRDNVIDKEIEKIKSLCPDIAIIEQ